MQTCIFFTGTSRKGYDWDIGEFGFQCGRDTTHGLYGIFHEIFTLERSSPAVKEFYNLRTRFNLRAEVVDRALGDQINQRFKNSWILSL